MNSSRKTIVTITGIRPDFIRMSQVFKRLDEHFNHILVHTGQHYDTMLSGVFFTELGIRTPDYILNTGKESSNHYEQLGYLSTAIPRLFKEHSIYPDLVLFLGDSNSAGVSFPLKKEGYRIGHIEAGMRSYDKRMLEELNRVVCDHCSDILFVYHEDYAAQLAQEGITKNVFVVGNTIVEPFRQFQSVIMKEPKRKDMILMDIHRPENFKYVDRLRAIIAFGNRCAETYGLPVKLLYFKRLQDMLDTHGIPLGSIKMIPLMAFQEYLATVYHAKFIISDSGTGQEEPGLLQTPTIVPRDFTERPQSYATNCSKQFTAASPNDKDIFDYITQLDTETIRMDTSWLGTGTTSYQIVQHLQEYLNPTVLNTISISAEDYQRRGPFPHMFQDNFLELGFAKALQAEILGLGVEQWDRYSNPFEQKYTLRDKYAFPEKLSYLFKELTEPSFVSKLSALVGHSLVLDTTRNFWGIHTYEPGDKLDIHVDAGFHPTLGLKKQVTLGLYLSYRWYPDYGCALEIWSGDSCVDPSANLLERCVQIQPLFNRLVIFTNNDISWHGNPEPATCPPDARRIFLTISYLSETTTDQNKRVKALFIKRPQDPQDNEKDRLRLLRADPEKFKEIYRI